ncbi:MAG: trimeric intracellular cation channel family protein [Hoeflea sp.]|uniref:trimeric intracellular cation channel family protein n=1 Tax=Hoeflea sp. TaxID=1940281 RepID=UPI001DA6816E|nr:trimeric intracellular cation channel family protein [Hoeflea sp.]MBU4531438.1 trimeric intracellular cation channel family protein [Alphaproteobacteria bacterium]MBU4544295.1 trimeric intracellular cation channel family protein [Alphaproteobacteria bacterium]MBU4550468.1 trimeric intracellular cation channel family protein [Alphaproteobacteria bacterium]MBV1724714.1 trimeric intracellular cation channel family protein [Hoeflea sp.]MBV1760734.1 trimeric intracellular cation channel family p
MTLLEILDYAGVAVFAATGALAASRKQLDMIGFIFLAAVTGIGGGTFRDIVLGATPVFWVQKPEYLLVCVGVAVIVYFTAHLVESRYRLLLWLDAVGLSAYSVMGAAKGLALSGSPIVALVTGMMTATLGGILRDLLSGEPSVLMRPEIYVSAALAGAGGFIAASLIGAPLIAASLAGVILAFAVRGGAIRYGWAFSPYKPRPGRPPEDVM